MLRKALKFRLYPNKEQEKQLFWTLARCRELYNAALSERKDSYQLHERTQLQVNPATGQVLAATMVAKQRVKSVTYLQQKRDLPEIKDLREEYQDIHSQVLQDVLLRLKRAFDGFFRRLGTAETPAFHASRDATAITPSPTHKQGASLFPMIVVSVSPRSARSRSTCIARWKGLQKRVPSNMRRDNGMPSSPVR